MIVHLIGSMREFETDLIPMQTIADTLHTHGVYIEHDWLAAVKSRKNRQSEHEEKLDWPSIVSANIQAIVNADALIVEGSRFNYSSAYQTAIALQHNKPVLNLYQTATPEFREWPDKLFVSGIDNPLFHNIAYKKQVDLPKIVEKFIKNVEQKTVDLDVKVSLSPHSHAYLKRQSEESNRSIAGIVKDIITQKSQDQH